MSSPLVTVIIPIYNAERHLKRCLDSVLLQSHQNLEIILINDGSTDASLAISRSYAKKDDRIILIDQENKGVSHTRNTGIDSATGEYITFVDADDWLESDAVENLLSLALGTGAECVRGMYYIDTDSNASGRHHLSVKEGLYGAENRTYLATLFLQGIEECYTVLLLVHRRALSSIRFNTSLRILEDTEFYIKLIATTDRFYLSDVATYHYYMNSQGATKSSSNYERNINGVLDASVAIASATQDLSLSKKNMKVIDKVHLAIVNNYIYLTIESQPKRLYDLTTNLRFDKNYRRLIHAPQSLSNIFNYLFAKSIIIRLYPMTRCLIFLKRYITKYPRLNQSREDCCK